MRENNELGYYGIAQELYKEAGPVWDAVKKHSRTAKEKLKGYKNSIGEKYKNLSPTTKKVLGGTVLAGGVAGGYAYGNRKHAMDKEAGPLWEAIKQHGRTAKIKIKG